MEALHVLIVDDETELVSALKERLALRGFVTEGVTTGQDALDFLDAEPCDVVLLDVKMPGLGGLEVIRRIKHRHPHLEVILLTGHGSEQSVEEGMSLGAFDYLMKPVKIDNLVNIISAAGSRAGRSASVEKEES
jgi:two-component system OmpR family response regulator